MSEAIKMATGAGESRRNHVLCVDDEARVIEGLVLHLRRDFVVHTALSGEEGLRKLTEVGGVAVVISDMRMPGMDGATFLKRVMRLHPETSRILLTGETGQDAAALAVNEGHILRFLTKPCPPQELKTAVEAGVMQHRLVTAERLMLQETLIGCINALIDVLAITNPVAFGRASRIKRTAMQFAKSLGCTGFWQLEAAAMLSQLGYIALPVELVEKLYYGDRLSAEEQVLTEAVPDVVAKLLGHIPRLEPVLEILTALNATDEQLSLLGEGTIGLGSRVLALVLEYDALATQGHSSDVAMKTLRGKRERYGDKLIDKFSAMLGASTGEAELREIQLKLVEPGMILQQDVRTHLGTLLIAKGFEISETFLGRLRNLGSTILDEKIRVLVPAVRASSRNGEQ